MSRRTRLGALLASAGVLTAVGARAEDRWFAEDKLLHFSVSAALAGGGYAAGSLVLDPPWQRAAAGAAFSLSLGAGKELYDLAGGGDPSLRDFTWDVLGTAVGIVAALAVDAVTGDAAREAEPAADGAMAVRF